MTNKTEKYRNDLIALIDNAMNSTIDNENKNIKTDALMTLKTFIQEHLSYELRYDSYDQEFYEKMEKGTPIFRELSNELSYLKKDDIKAISEIIKNKNKPVNFILEGDNLHSLNLLKKTHIKNGAGIIDIIYIDPPYNTGEDGFRYKDGWQHSEWLSFMEERLMIAKDLLSNDGLIYISIDEHEYAQIKLLCDKIFNPENYVENFIWVKNSTKNNSKTSSTNHEYILCYAKNIFAVSKNSTLMRVKKDGYYEILEFVENCKKKGLTPKQAECELSAFLKIKEEEGLKGVTSYKFIDEDYNVYGSFDLSAPDSSHFYEIIHPVTKKPCKNSVRGWGYSETSFQELLDKGRVLFGKDENNVPRQKKLLAEMETEVMKSVIINNSEGTREIKNILGTETASFNNPKPISLIKHIISSVGRDAIVLDFFAGSGTTGQAVMELNEEDGGNRKFILCTNNEISAKMKLEYIHNCGYMLDFKAGNKKASAILEEIDKFFGDKLDLAKQLFEDNAVEYNSYGICRGVLYRRILNTVTKNNLETNVRYFICDWVDKNKTSVEKEQDYCKNIHPILQLDFFENVIPSDENYVAFGQDDFEKLLLNNCELLDKIKVLFVPKNIVLPSQIEKRILNLLIKKVDIPDNYYI